MLIIQSVKSGSVNVPLWGNSGGYNNNQEFLHAYLNNMIGSAFSNLTS